MRAPDAVQRVALREAVRCRAGAIQSVVFGTVPLLRSGMKNAASRPGHAGSALDERLFDHEVAGLAVAALEETARFEH